MIDEPSSFRFLEALERREDERRQYRARLAGASSLREYIDIQHEHDRSAPPLQTTANMGYPTAKARR